LSITETKTPYPFLIQGKHNLKDYTVYKKTELNVLMTASFVEKRTVN
jgi:hypothetical protein